MPYFLKQRRIWILFASIVILLVVFVFSQLVVQGATYTMTVDGSADDTLANLSGNGTCDLREAIDAANSYTTVADCSLPGGLASTDDFLINFDVAVTTIALELELSQIEATIEIQGGEVIEIEVQDGNNILDLKNRIKLLRGIPIKNQHLFYKDVSNDGMDDVDDDNIEEEEMDTIPLDNFTNEEKRLLLVIHN